MKGSSIEEQEAGEYVQDRGKTTVAPEVLLNIARLTTLNVHGVSRMGNVPSGFNRLFNRGYGEGVRLDIRNDVVYADLHVILQADVNIREVSRQIQHSVNRAIVEMVGMQVGRVNVHIEDIDYPGESEESQTEEA